MGIDCVVNRVDWAIAVKAGTSLSTDDGVCEIELFPDRRLFDFNSIYDMVRETLNSEERLIADEYMCHLFWNGPDSSWDDPTEEEAEDPDYDSDDEENYCATMLDERLEEAMEDRISIELDGFDPRETYFAWIYSPNTIERLFELSEHIDFDRFKIMVDQLFSPDLSKHIETSSVGWHPKMVRRFLEFHENGFPCGANFESSDDAFSVISAFNNAIASAKNEGQGLFLWASD
jgi:hypothetical protein